jgi:hypothetical protein
MLLTEWFKHMGGINLDLIVVNIQPICIFLIHILFLDLVRGKTWYSYFCVTHMLIAEGIWYRLVLGGVGLDLRYRMDKCSPSA